jgi:predicted secreted protein
VSVRVAALLLLVATSAAAQVTRYESSPATQPVVTVTASASATVVNDRMHAALRAEAENADAAQAARDVNARLARALAKAKATAGVTASTAGYASYQVGEKDRIRWRVSQGLALEGTDFAALAALVSRLQVEDGLLVSGLGFSVGTEKQRATEDQLTQQAIRAWQRRADAAAEGFGGTSWRPGRITIQPADGARPQPMLRAQAMAAGGGAAPISAEAGTTEITVSVSGEVILETVRSPAR